jgi:single-strand DNA-binding protein
LQQVFGEFRVVADPELRFTPSGKAVGNVRLVANSRKLNKDTDQWEDDKVVWLNGSIWDREAENMVESISKGDLVEVRGRLETREWEKDGEKRQSVEVKIDSISPSIKYATAKVTKVERTSGTPATSGREASGPAEDPWASNPSTDEPPF